MAWGTTSTSTSASTCHHQPWSSSSNHAQSPWWCHGFNNLRGAARSSAEWKNLLCSPTMSWSAHIIWKHSRWTTCCTTSASTSGTHGIATCLLPLWISVGKIRLGTPSPFAMRTAWLNFSMNFVLIGLKAKNLVSYFRIIFDISRLRISHTSCAWVAMRHFPTATCFHKAGKSSPCIMWQLPSSTSCFCLHLFVGCCFYFLASFTLRHPSALGFSFNMTKRDSCLAHINSPRAPTSMQRRHLQFEGQSSSGATSSGQRPQPSSAMDNLAPQSHPGIDHSDSSSYYGYASTSPVCSSTWCSCPPYPNAAFAWRSLPAPGGDRTTASNSPYSILTSSQRSYLLTSQDVEDQP